MNKKEKIKCPYCSESLNSDEIGEEKNDITALFIRKLSLKI
jgi:hypothetical protein